MAANKFNRITQYIKLSDLYDESVIVELPKLLLDFPNPNEPENTPVEVEKEPETIESHIINNETDTEPNAEYYDNLYKSCWKDLPDKQLFHDDFKFFCGYLDTIEDKDFDRFVQSIVEQTYTPEIITSNELYNSLYIEFERSGFKVEEMFKTYNNKKIDNVTLLDVFNNIDNNILTQKELIIASQFMIILVTKNTKDLLEAKQRLLLSCDFIDRELVYASQKNGTVFISIMEYQ
jgi:hypothetical protein